MGEMKHTPRWVYLDTGEVFIDEDADGEGGLGEPILTLAAPADAIGYLAASAPELLAELKKIVEPANATWAAAGGLGCHPGYISATFAIAKAEGRS